MSLNPVLDLLHLLATATWIGGMLFMKLVLIPARAAIDPAQQGRLMGEVAKRFTIVAWSSVVILLITGFAKTPSQYLFDLGTSYGKLLFAKHALIVLTIVVGLVITFAVAPKLGRLAPPPGAAPSSELIAAEKQVDALSAVNTILALVILVLVAVMKP